MKVLVVDDDPDIRRIAQIALGRLGGMDVVEAAGSAQGLALAASFQPDVILLDVMMPGVDGIATLRALQGDPTTAGIPVVFLTARMASGDGASLTHLGATGVLAKPFDPMTLAERLRTLVATPPEKQH